MYDDLWIILKKSRNRLQFSTLFLNFAMSKEKKKDESDRTNKSAN